VNLRFSAFEDRHKPYPPAPAPANGVISYIFSDGVFPRVDSDEYAQTTNTGGEGQDFGLPSFELQPGQSCRVYTNEMHGDSCGGTFGSGRAIWNNDGDCGYLFNAKGALVSEYCY
jgi:hypothetical protein